MYELVLTKHVADYRTNHCKLCTQVDSHIILFEPTVISPVDDIVFRGRLLMITVGSNRIIWSLSTWRIALCNDTLAEDVD